MRLNRFYTARTNLRIGSSVKLEDSDIKHIRKVLRLGKKDNIILFNGEKEFVAELKIVGAELITAKIIELRKEEDFSNENKVELTIFQCLLRSGKFDFIIEKTTELNIDNIVPVESNFSQTKLDIAKKKTERWNKVAIAAAKQCERITIPNISLPIEFKEISHILKDFDKIYFFTIPRANINISLKTLKLQKALINKGNTLIKKVAFLIGPEGGFSPGEHILANEWGLDFVTFGETILRSETAAISVTSILQFIYNA